MGKKSKIILEELEKPFQEERSEEKDKKEKEKKKMKDKDKEVPRQNKPICLRSLENEIQELELENPTFSQSQF